MALPPEGEGSNRRAKRIASESHCARATARESQRRVRATGRRHQRPRGTRPCGYAACGRAHTRKRVPAPPRLRGHKMRIAGGIDSLAPDVFWTALKKAVFRRPLIAADYHVVHGLSGRRCKQGLTVVQLCSLSV